ncbi:anaerobic ribonucleoside-triphosphate reductase [Sutterella sp.]|uniref:anaerobic ribonucleoside-triphosphate reductase n=1 Tax=Sutterella sp. TaxID=1981025 RepID=UPI0026E041C6|nr:anaerobic ribonucleoside-triphosphate reductase [Sutterella sp.]MDO5531117.1 anaerobic ribonucleoside-triphosphate reductase [Sutterella sp.]
MAENETIELKDNERQKCEVWTRVMGYHRPVQSFNIGKKGEFQERVCFTEQRADAHGEIARPCCGR